MKTNLRAAVANALSFAHLSGVTGKASAKAEDDDEKKKDPPASDDTSKAEGDDPEKEDDEKKDAKAADDTSDPEDDDEKKDAKKASASDEDDDDEEMHGKSAAASARRREQARCAAIFASPAAARNVALAANLAFKTRMSRAEAIAVLEGTPGTAPAGASRAASNPQLGAGGERSMGSAKAVASSWSNAFAKVPRV